GLRAGGGGCAAPPHRAGPDSQIDFADRTDLLAGDGAGIHPLRPKGQQVLLHGPTFLSVPAGSRTARAGPGRDSSAGLGPLRGPAAASKLLTPPPWDRVW